MRAVLKKKQFSQTNIVSWSLLIVMVTFPLFFLDDWRDYRYDLQENRTTLFRAIGFFQFLIVSILTFSTKTFMAMVKFYPNRLLMLSIFIFLSFMSSIYSINPTASIVGSIALFAISFSFISGPFANTKYLLHTYQIMTFILLSLIFFLFIYHGLDGRRVGGVPANQIGKLAFATICLAVLLPKLARVLIWGICLSAVLIVSSRSSMLMIVIFFTLYYLVELNLKKAITYFLAGTTILLICALGLLLSENLGHFILTDVLYAADPDRGLSSGMTGRVLYWAEGLSQFEASPVLGYGFQTRESLNPSELSRINAHHGFINLLLDLGILGFSVFILLAFSAIFGNWRQYKRWHLLGSDGEKDLFRFRLCYILSYMASWFIEPAYFNFGTSYSLIFVTCLLPVHNFVRYSDRHSVQADGTIGLRV